MATAINDAEILNKIREMIREYEGLDDWNVPYVYTKRFRELLGMEPSPL